MCKTVTKLGLGLKWAGNTYGPQSLFFMQSKYWCFTFNNYEENDVNTLEQTLRNAGVTYYVFGREVGESGTRHLQGYLEFSRKKRFNTVKQVIGFDRIHLECRRGNATQASEYCKKEGDFLEWGSISQTEQGI